MILDQRLQNDCIVLAESDISFLLLMNNSLIPWFIIVPKTEKTEFFELDVSLQYQLMSQIKQLSHFVKLTFSVDKLNIATIGNVVEQMHIHVVGRFRTDFCWPDVVWGQSQKELYSGDEVNKIREYLAGNLAGSDFLPI